MDNFIQIGIIRMERTLAYLKYLAANWTAYQGQHSNFQMGSSHRKDQRNHHVPAKRWHGLFSERPGKQSRRTPNVWINSNFIDKAYKKQKNNGITHKALHAQPEFDVAWTWNQCLQILRRGKRIWYLIIVASWKIICHP